MHRTKDIIQEASAIFVEEHIKVMCSLPLHIR